MIGLTASLLALTQRVGKVMNVVCGYRSAEVSALGFLSLAPAAGAIVLRRMRPAGRLDGEGCP
jgi:hypothetical protein